MNLENAIMKHEEFRQRLQKTWSIYKSYLRPRINMKCLTLFKAREKKNISLSSEFRVYAIYCMNKEEISVCEKI